MSETMNNQEAIRSGRFGSALSRCKEPPPISQDIAAVATTPLVPNHGSVATAGSPVNSYTQTVPRWVWQSRLAGIVARLSVISDVVGGPANVQGDPIAQEIRCSVDQLSVLAKEWSSDTVT